MRKVTIPEPLGAPEPLPPIKFESIMKFTSAPLQEAFGYWNSVRAKRIMPTRSEIRPRDMRSFLANVGLVDLRRDDNGVTDYFVRLAGSRVEDIFGARTGRSLDQGVPPEIAERWRLGFDMVLRSGKPVKATSRVAFQGKNWIEVEILVAPLGEDPTPSSFLVVISKLNRS